jgi:hypothetical protein
LITTLASPQKMGGGESKGKKETRLWLVYMSSKFASSSVFTVFTRLRESADAIPDESTTSIITCHPNCRRHSPIVGSTLHNFVCQCLECHREYCLRTQRSTLSPVGRNALSIFVLHAYAFVHPPHNAGHHFMIRTSRMRCLWIPG